MSYSTRRLYRAVVYFLCALLAMPPGFGTQRLRAASRTTAMTRDAALETFRNPMFSSGAANRFLYTYMTSGLVAGGGEALPAAKREGVK